ncbi:hypothetical protein, partial [Salmonella sp. SAL04286]|uniref:hypothetical protein n=1 Tax=Salmonella sp. SAL04286 TaxID=3159864 RepID=UPI00397969C1
MPDNKIIEKTKVVDSSKNSTVRTEEASSHLNLSSNNNISKGILKLQFDHKNYPISYQITGAGNKINDIKVENDNTTIIAHVTSQS